MVSRGSGSSASSATGRLLSATGCGASGSIADKSGFEDADGNLAINTDGCMDWNGFNPVTWTPSGGEPYQTATKTATTTSGTYTFFGASDAFNSNTDSSYAGGVKQADECPATGTGSVDNKTDLARIYVAASTDPVTKHVYLDLAWIRAPQNNISSDVHVGFEFNQGTTACPAGSSPLVHRTKGDILLVYNFQSGTASIAMATWTGSAWTTETTLASNIAEALVYTGTPTITDSIKPSNGLDPGSEEFGEAGIDLTAATVGLSNNGRACEQFGRVFGESRTSGSSTSAQMKDIDGPANIDLSNCVTPKLVTTQQPASGAIGDTFKDKATLSDGANYDGSGTITFNLYPNADCTGTPLDTETVTGISANGDYTTPNGVQINHAGTYYWVASFSGDGFNNQSSSGCADEPVVVAKNSPALSTTQNPSSGAIGDLYKDTAHLSGGAAPTGTITFKLYSAADCGGSVLDTESATVSGNGDYSTPTGFHIQHAGTYYWVASYGGDSDNNAAGPTGCNDEPVTVAKNSPTLSTTQNPSSGAIGDLYKDTAHLSGGASPTGTITFKLYSAADCGGSVLDTETATVSGNGDYSTPTGFHIQHAGTYYWVASYGGDSDNNAAGPTGCNDEPVTVAKNSPTLSTTQAPASGAIGDLYKDTAHLLGGASPTGTITFKLYSNNDCTGLLDTETATVSGNGDYSTPTGFHIQHAGTYYWVASYGGDSDNNAAGPTGCTDEPVTVAKNSPALSTTQNPNSGPIGALYKDTAHLSGGAAPTGTITFKLYSNPDCTGLLDTETATVSGNGDYSTPTGFHIQNAGTYYWVASYGGDSDNNAAGPTGCTDEPVDVAPNQPSLVTTQKPASGAIGDTYKDTATLSGGSNYDGSGSITFTLYSGPGCGGTVLDTETVTGVNANGDYTTPTGFQIQNAGTYYWVASFSGDPNNGLAGTGCNDEPVTVGKNQPSIVTTQLPDSGAIGDTYKDKATLSGAANPDGTGSITFKLYSAADCGGTVLDTETVTGVNANGDYTTPDGFQIQNAGTYYWVASFSGDSNNKSFTSGCNDEPVTVEKNQPSIVTTQLPDSGAIGDTYKDKATLSGGVNYDGTGSITFKLYSAKDCGGTVLDTETVTGVNANGDYTTPTGFQIQNAGLYYWVASFSGDSNNKSFTSGCNDEPVGVALNQPSIVTTQLPDSGAIGDTYKDKATLSGAANLDGTGSITFKLYSAKDCGGTVLDTETVTGVNANGDYTTPDGFQIQNAGTYYWVASFSGDSNNAPFTSGCNDEPVTVGKNQPSIVTTQLPDSGAIGDTYKDKATLSGGVNYDGTGSITFKLYSAADCGGTVLDTETVTGVNANGDYTTPDGFQIQNAGTYYWVASFSGDSNNKSFTSGCNDEPVTVGKNQPSIVTTQLPDSGSVGDTYKDKATLSGAANLDGTGSITFKLYSAKDCGGTVLDTETVDSVSANGDYTTPTGVQLNTSGTYYWVASFSGDSNNAPFTSPCNDEPVVVNPADIQLTKTADHSAPVNAGDQIGFTVEIKNTGTGNATGVVLSDPLPAGSGSGVTWSIDSSVGTPGQFALSGAKGSQTLTLNGQPVTMPAGADWKVHIVASTSQTECSVYDNTATLTIENGVSPNPASAEESCQFRVDLSITKAGSPATQTLGDGNITWTIVVTNNGPDMDTGVQISDPMPAGNTFVSAATTKGTCTGGAVLHCNIGDMAAGEKVTITLVTTPSTVGDQTNTVMVVGDRHESNTSNNTATATVVTVGKITPPVYCIAVSRITPKQLFVGRKTGVKIHVTQVNQTTHQVKAIKGVHVRIKGAKLNIKTKASNAKGLIKQTIKAKKAGILVFTPIATKHCNTKRVGITGVFTPPVTG